MGLFDSGNANEYGALAARLTAVERKLDAIMAQLQIPDPTPQFAGNDMVLDLVAQGRKIEAIRVYRESTQASLADAKAYVESLDRLR